MLTICRLESHHIFLGGGDLYDHLMSTRIFTLDMLIILHHLCVPYTMRSGCRERGVRLKAHLPYWLMNVMLLHRISCEESIAKRMDDRI